ncbi:MAG TPA: hypothetical protein VHN99_07500 [Deinococcales bacterium]|nr:hypothetical protein [Deinococcales bacterium]
MLRIFVLVVALGLGALVVGYVARRLAGRNAGRGLVWGLAGGVVGTWLVGTLLDALGATTGFMTLDYPSWQMGLVLTAFFGWNVGLIGGLIGSLLAWPRAAARPVAGPRRRP